MKIKLLFVALATASIVFAQEKTGINTTNPSATLDVVSGGNDATTKALEVNNVDGVEVVTVLDDGKVGIGKNNPTEKLEVKGKVKGNMFIIEPGTDNPRVYFNSTSTYSPRVIDVSSGKFRFYREGGTEGTKVFTVIGANDNMGIGTETPTEKLEVNGNVKASSLAGAGDRMVVADANGVLKTGTGTVAQATSKWTNDAANNVVKLTNLSNGTTGRTDNKNIFVKDDGNVGVGTITPQAKLDVNGNVKIVDGTQGAGKVLTSDANGVATWQSTGLSAPQGSFLWDATNTSNTIDPDLNTLKTYGPFTVPNTGYYMVRSRWFYTQNFDTNNGGSSDLGAAHVWMQISKNATQMDLDIIYEYRFAVNGGAISPPTGSLIYLEQGTNYYIHQKTYATKYTGTGERLLRLSYVQ